MRERVAEEDTALGLESLWHDVRGALRVFRRSPGFSLVVVATREFREVVKLAILVFVVTGAILTVSRLSFPRVSAAYVAVLAVKLTLSTATNAPNSLRRLSTWIMARLH